MNKIIFGFLLFSFQFCFAFTLADSSNSNLQGWSDSNIQFVVNTSNCPGSVDVPGLINEAAQIWNNVATSSVKLSYGGSTASTTYSIPTTVYCETNFATATGGADINFVPAAANTQKTNGTITSGLLILNVSGGNANIANFDQTKLKIIIAHEIGHVLGLGHSASVNALMYYDASAKTSLHLSQDDIDGVSYLYPKNELSDGKIAGCGFVKSQTPPPSGRTLLTLLFLMLLPLATLTKLKNFKKS